MKSHDLARKLLSLPDLDVFSENKVHGNPNWEFHTHRHDGEVTITPTGLFLGSEIHNKSYTDRSPNDEPVIGSYMIFLSDGTVLKDDRRDDSRICTPTVKFLSTGESRTQEYGFHNMDIHDNCKVYHRTHEKNIVLVTNKETYETQPLYVDSDENFVHHYVEDIDYVKVLVSYDKDTWCPEYKAMSYWDAVAYGKSL